MSEERQRLLESYRQLSTDYLPRLTSQFMRCFGGSSVTREVRRVENMIRGVVGSDNQTRLAHLSDESLDELIRTSHAQMAQMNRFLSAVTDERVRRGLGVVRPIPAQDTLF